MFKPKKNKGGKTLAQNVKDVKDERRSEVNSELVSMFLTLQEKLNSPVFNGGFDRLLGKVENIEANLKVASAAVETLNRLIYEPDEGLFSRIKKVEADRVIELQKISSAQEKFKEDIGEIKVSIAENSTTTKDVQELKTKVDALTLWRAELARKLWIMIPVVIALLGKIGWDIIVAHVTVK